jgi:primosomal protein N' (replication factor Y)
MRSTRHSVTFYCHSPSLELVRLVESKWMRLRQKRGVRKSVSFKNGRIPYQAVVKNGLRTGPVLVLVPEKGYVNALVCSKCRNILKCDLCGGRVIQSGRDTLPYCQMCRNPLPTHKCNFCSSDKFLNFSKGIDKTLEEMGKQFPNTAITKYIGNNEIFKRGQLVLANYSNFPIYKFSSIVMLGFEKFGYQNKLRSAEIARKLIFDIRALGAEEYYLDVEASDYFAQVFQSGDSFKIALKELTERTVAKLPPEFRIALIECDSKARSVLEDQPFVDSVTYLSGQALLKSSVKNGAKLSNFLQGIANYRSIKKLKPWNIKIDPLDI